MKLSNIFFILLFIFIISCSGKQIVSGNLPDIDKLSLLELGKDNKKSVVNLLGTHHLKARLVIIRIIILEH